MYYLLLFSLLVTSVLPATATLESDLKGKGLSIVFPGDKLYPNVSQAFNLRFTFRPAAITFPATPQQVSEVVQVGAKYSHQVVARSGGHSYIANGLGGKNGVVVVDLRNFTKISVDSASGVAVVESGNKLGEIAQALGDKGRGMPHGVCPYVGIGGHTAFGGFGFMSRMWGLTLDNIISLNVVLANGTITSASKAQNSELFWGMRGSGSSFGITTSTTFNSYSAPASATAIQISWNLNVDEATKGLENFQNFVQSNLPREFGGEVLLTKGPIQGNVTFALRAAYYGPTANVNSTISPFLNLLPTPTATIFTSGTYIDIVTYLGGYGTLNTSVGPESPNTFYAKSVMTPENSPMSLSARKAFISYLANDGFLSVTNWFVEVELYGGTNSAINAVPFDATAFAHRSSMFNLQLYASSSNGLPPYPDVGFSFVEGMADAIISNSPPNWDYGAYTNYADDRLKNWKKLYYGVHYARLHELKDIYDPKGTFSFPTAIED